MLGEAGLVSIRVTAEAAEGELLVGLLRSEGIAARLDRAPSALIGAAPHLFRIEVLVPEADAARAQELLADLEYVGAAEAADRGEATQRGEGEGETATPAPRRPVVGAGLAFLFPGGCHLYAGQVRTAIVV